MTSTVGDIEFLAHRMGAMMSKDTRIIRDDEILDEFWHAGATTGSIVRRCKHGITWFHDDEGAGDWGEGELETLRRDVLNLKTGALDRDAYFTEQLGEEWCFSCQKCRREILQWQNFLWNHRYSISSYLNERLKLEAERSAKEKKECTIERI